MNIKGDNDDMVTDKQKSEIITFNVAKLLTYLL